MGRVNHILDTLPQEFFNALKDVKNEIDDLHYSPKGVEKLLTYSPNVKRIFNKLFSQYDITRFLNDNNCNYNSSDDAYIDFCDYCKSYIQRKNLVAKRLKYIIAKEFIFNNKILQPGNKIETKVKIISKQSLNNDYLITLQAEDGTEFTWNAEGGVNDEGNINLSELIEPNDILNIVAFVSDVKNDKCYIGDMQLSQCSRILTKRMSKVRQKFTNNNDISKEIVKKITHKAKDSFALDDLQDNVGDVVELEIGCDWDDDGSTRERPFVFVDNQLYIGKKGEQHSDVVHRINNNNEVQGTRRTKNMVNYIRNEQGEHIESMGYGGISGKSAWIDEQNSINCNTTDIADSLKQHSIRKIYTTDNSDKFLTLYWKQK